MAVAVSRGRRPSRASNSVLRSSGRRDDSVGREALHREWASDTDLASVQVGPVVEHLTSAARLIEESISRCREIRASHHAACACRAASGQRCRPRAGSATPPGLPEGDVQFATQGFELGLEALPDHVDLCVVGDRLEGDVRRTLIDEALANIAIGRALRLRPARDRLLLGSAFGLSASR